MNVMRTFVGGVLPGAFLISSVALSPADSLDNWHSLDIWPSLSNAASNQITALGYGDGRFVAIDEILDGSSSSFVLASTDGKNWLRQSADTNLHAAGILAVGNGAVLTASDPFFRWPWGMMRSTNGSNWSAILPGAMYVRFADGIFNAVGYVVYEICLDPPCGPWPALWRSTDGFNWQETILSNEEAVITRGQFARGNGVSIVMGNLDPNYFTGPPGVRQIVVWSSTNELNWTKRALPAWGAGWSSFGLAYGNGVFVAIVRTAQIFTSTDGATWTIRQPVTNAILNSVAFGGGQFVVVGDGGVILTSGDATDWKARNSGTSSNLYDLQFVDHTFLVWGSGRTVLRSDPVIQFNLAFAPTAQLTISGPTGAVYQIEAAADLSLTNSWQNLTNITIPVSPYTWTNTETPTEATRFYRAVMVAP